MEIKSVSEENRGSLLKIVLDDLTFSPVEMLTINNVPVGTVRGMHAHKITEQLLLLVEGEIEVRAVFPHETIVVKLTNRGDYFYLPPLTWGEQKFLKLGTILQVYSSTIYDPTDYITEFAELKARWAE